MAALTAPSTVAYPERSMMRNNSGQPRFDLFAQTAPGLEAVTAAELKGLELKPHKEIGGVAFRGDLEQLYDANLWLRTASRIVVRAGTFYASTFSELERRARKIPWENFLPKDGPVRVRVTCRKSRLYHSDAVAERILSAIARVAPRGVELADNGKSDDESSDETSERSGGQLFIVRIVSDQCEISADSSGDLLHRRGYRLDVAKAPLRETLAAAMVLASGWKAGTDLLDPLCG
ncbi:MAG TPA: THUMP domain-containing protein, partial [Gemmatimonadaceae bacterium]|nr:THUMP domain-containing protein [Gemmatimonadaceae bacterium]